MKISRVVLGMGSLMMLAACQSDYQSSATLNVSQSFNLENSKGQSVAFASGASTVTLQYTKLEEKLDLVTADGSAFSFMNTKFNASTGVLATDASLDSGQRDADGDPVDVSIPVTKICDPNCQTVSVVRKTVDCSYEAGQTCTTDGSGSIICTPIYEEGTQVVDDTMTTTRYQLGGGLNKIVSGTDVSVAGISGVYTDVSEKYADVTDCGPGSL